MARAVLLTGSNMGEKRYLLNRACTLIAKQIGPVVCESSIYESEPWGFQSDETFLNQALLIETKLEPIALLNAIQTIEKELGRKRKEAPPDEVRIYESRPIDIDILFYDDLILNEERLRIPHPLLAEREFVLVPLREILPDYIHPVLQKPVCDL